MDTDCIKAGWGCRLQAAPTEPSSLLPVHKLGATSSPGLQAGCWEPEQEDKQPCAAVPLKAAGLGK